MGKPFFKEVECLPQTIEWALHEEITELYHYLVTLKNKPLLAIGSGGSYSAAGFLSQLHEAAYGKVAKALSPLEFIQNAELPETALCLLSASGNNIDILRAWAIAIQRDNSHIFALTMQENTQLAIKAQKTSTRVIEFIPPCGKDGFLATNSLIGTSILLLRGYFKILGIENQEIPNIANLTQSEFPDALFQRTDWLVLSSGWAWPAAIDFESKCSEAALMRVLLSDFRNFGHGRHVWLDKRQQNTAIVIFSTPTESKLVQKTLEFIPSEIPYIVFESKIAGPWATIELLAKVIMLTGKLGQFIGRDPGRPGVPVFGRKLYRLGPVGLSSRRSGKTKTIWLQRKQRIMGLSNKNAPALQRALSGFLKRLTKAKFTGIILDYDGTLCDPDERFFPINSNIVKELNRLLEGKLKLGIATGRGKSVRERLIEAINPVYQENVWIGYYNGACILKLTEAFRHKDYTKSSLFNEVEKRLSPLELGKIDIRAHQLSITPEEGDVVKLSNTITKLLKEIQGVQVCYSAHSVDIRLANVSKLLLYHKFSSDGDILTIGDSGAPGGNDEELLSTPYSLSCFEPTVLPDSGWHIAPRGCHFSKATMCYLSALDIMDKGIAKFNHKFPK